MPFGNTGPQPLVEDNVVTTCRNLAFLLIIAVR